MKKATDEAKDWIRLATAHYTVTATTVPTTHGDPALSLIVERRTDNKSIGAFRSVAAAIEAISSDKFGKDWSIATYCQQLTRLH